ncbi:endonuclease/exonuclease/phosphatase family protein [Cellulomonas sp. WB94]|uniref:endonuclease/exonuclease/phosphatase family protein n=1 Tax=Cellulomonas sp. WB94 TaxID=2173174 RepID=UPI0011B2573A|nr:endonuclease/exonuclease/phosphatase family protein [Cellulomonas sp. WB94]
MTYNVKGLSVDAEAAAQVVRDADPDVLGIQEPPRGPVGAARLRRFAADVGMRPVVTGHGARTTALLVADLRVGTVEAAAAVRLPMLGRRELLAPPIPRGYARATVAGVQVVVVHLSLDPAERARHVTRILADVRSRLDAGGQCVVVGDLNELPDGPAWARFGVHLRDSATDPQPTFTALRPGQRIDVVLVSDGLRVVASHVPSGTAAERGSDHRPVVADLALPH